MKNTIKVQRAIHGLTQPALAQKINKSKWSVSQMELNHYKPSVVTALKMARLFNVSVEEIFKFEEGDL